MNFEPEDRTRMRITLIYDLLQDFARRLYMPFDTATNEINIIILRGARPLDNTEVVDTLEEVTEQIMDYDRLHEIQQDLLQLIAEQEKIIETKHEVEVTDENMEAIARQLSKMILTLMKYQDGLLKAIPDIRHLDLNVFQRIVFGGEEKGRKKVLEVLLEKQKGLEQALDTLIRSCGSFSDLQPIKKLAQKQKDIAKKATKIIEAYIKFLDEDIQDRTCTIELANDVIDRYNDTIVFVWKDAEGHPHIRAFLCSADPGIKYIRHPMEGHPGAASIAPGSYDAKWGEHKGNYPCLDIKRKGSIRYSGRRITKYHIDEGETPGDTRETRKDDTTTVVEYTYYESGTVPHAPGGIQIHAGGEPENIIYDWSGGCIVIAGSKEGSYKDPSNVYDQIFGGSGIERKDSWLGIESQGKFNVIVWNAWTLYELKKSGRRGRSFRPIIEFGAEDLPKPEKGDKDIYDGHPDAVRWVARMQEALNRQIPKLTARWKDIEESFKRERKQLSEQFPLFIDPNMELPVLAPLEKVDGKFGNDTGAALRTFQLVCFLLLLKGGLRLRGAGSVNKDEVMWERNKWICGPQTWELLDSRNLGVKG